MQNDVSDLRQKRRQRLLAAAQEVFVSQGFRASSMEGIAASASVSKATLYSYFADKEAVFDAVAETVARHLLSLVQTELERLEDPADAVIAALTAKHLHVFKLVRSSAFATELFATNTVISRRHFQSVDTKIADLIAYRMSSLRDDADERANILLAASQGIANNSKTEENLRDWIAELRVLIT